MRKEVSARALLQILKELGFVELRHTAGHVLIRHRDKKLVVTLPSGNQLVAPSIVQGILRQIENFNIESREELAKRMERRR
jgi:predicted RNA binding protein YcfA (HicA-like mRNA interferase family)